MSITMTKSEGVTVLTMAANTKSPWPPLCQILGALCYNPLCCSVSQRLRTLQATSQSVLGTVQIMLGLLNIGLGGILLSGSSYSPLFWMAAPYWLGGVYIAVGIVCILAGRFPSVCLVGINVLMNMAGVAFAITGIVLYSIDLGYNKLPWSCSTNDYYSDYGYRRRYNGDYGYGQMTTVMPIEEQMRIKRLAQDYMEKCNSMKDIAVVLLTSLDVVLLILAIIQLCVTISSVVMGIKTLRKHTKEPEGKSCKEYYNPLLEEVTTTNPAA